MAIESLGFIGGGRVTRIMLGGWDRAAGTDLDVIVADPDTAALDLLQEELSGITVVPGSPEQAARQEVVFLALHPPALPGAVAGIGPELEEGSIVVSLAPVHTLAAVSGMLDGFPAVARMIPNAPSIVGRGFNPVAVADAVSAPDRGRLLELVAPLGECPEVEEELLEAYAVLTAMGPTYLWFQLRELERLGEDFGIEAPALRAGIRQMAMGAVETLYEAGLSAEQVIDLIPVKPLGEEEGTIRDIYRTRLEALHGKLTARGG